MVDICEEKVPFRGLSNIERRLKDRNVYFSSFYYPISDH